MHCFFNLAAGKQVILDDEGVEVDDVNELRTEVTKALDEVRHADPSGARDWDGWRLEVTDASGRVLLRINLEPFKPKTLTGLLIFECCELGEHLTNMFPNEIPVWIA